MASQLSVTIITYNEAHNIERCISGVSVIADEVIVLDSFSTDDTVAKAKKLGARVEQRKWEGYAKAKNYLNSLAQFPFVFSIDADEVPDEELVAEIKRIKADGLATTEVYEVNRLTNYCGSWIKHSGWYPDRKIRIFANACATWEGNYVHEELEFSNTPNVVRLGGHLLHYSYYSLKDHRLRADKYSALTAQKMFSKGKKAHFLKPYLSAVGRFISMYILKKGFLDGRAGLQIACISAKSNIFKYKELIRLNRGN